MTTLRHYDNTGMVRFVTFVCRRRVAWLADPTLIRLLIQQIAVWRVAHDIKLLGYVIMPDHVHLVLLPPEMHRLGKTIGQLKGLTARVVLRRWRQVGASVPGDLCLDGSKVEKMGRRYALWERRCYDHNCRTESAVWEKVRYCHNNPVRRGLVADPGAWEWSSYRWYEGEREVPLPMDEVV